MNKTCRSIRQYIDELEPSQQLTESAQAHLSECSSCREFRAQRGELRDLIGSLEPVTAPADFDTRLRARIARERIQPQGRFFSFPFAVSTSALAAAAMIIVAVVVTVWLMQRNPPQPVHTVSVGTPPVHNVGKATEGKAPVDKNVPVNSGNELAGVIKNPTTISSKRPVRATNTSDFNAEPARSIKQNGANQVVVNAPRKPLVVSLEDDRGMTRKVSLPPVSFGSHSLVDNRVPVSTNSRVW